MGGWSNGKHNGGYYGILGYIGDHGYRVLGLYWGYMGLMEKKMEVTILAIY